jgi:hypothetical protein
LLTPTTNSNQIRRYRSSNFDCQSPLPDSIQSFRAIGVADRPQARADAWTRGGGCTLVVAPPVRPRGLQGRHKASTHPHSCPCPSLSPSLSQGGAPRCHCRRVLPHARVPSSSRLDPIPSGSSTLAPSSTLSTPSLDCLSEGKAALADFATAAMCGTSPEFEAAEVGLARTLPSLFFSLH